MANFDIWISESKTTKSGKKYAVHHRHLEFIMKMDGYANDDVNAPTMWTELNKFSVMVLCENYQRGKTVKTWRAHKTFDNKIDAMAYFKKLK